MPRKSTQLRGPRDDTHKKKPAQKRKSGKILNALSIAEAQNPTRFKIRRNRLGDDDDYFKRKHNDDDEDNGPSQNKRRRTGDDDDDEIDSDEGSDGDGQKWKIGVDSDNDSELDSDEALGSSDEERFEGFAFRGSSTTKKPNAKAQKPKRERKLDLSEGEESDADEDMEDDDDDLGEDAIDLVAAWDMNTAEEEAEAKKASKSKKRDESEESDEDVSESDDESEPDEKDDSDLSMSDEETGNADGLSKLQNFVDSMDTSHASKPPVKRTKSGQEHLNPSEFGLTSTKKLTVADLLPSVTDSRLKNSLKHVDSAPSSQKTPSGIPGKLDAPLAKRQQDRLDREAAYEKSKETLGRWIETVKANRRAEHLMFPLPDPDAQMSHSLNVVKPQTGLENTIQDILVESGLADAQGKSAEDQVQEFEELEARKLPIEEIRARRAELRKHRDLLFREEVRAKRIKKIKSKSFRRVHRKEQERMEQKERQALLDAGVDLDEQDREKNERLRAEARMGNKHKESKWAKSLKQTGRTAWDEDARHGAVELAQREALREEELRQRIEGKRVTRGEEDYLGSSSESEEDENPWEEQDSDSEKRKIAKKLSKLEDDEAADGEIKGPHSKLLSMKFMQNAEAARKAQNDAEVRRLNRELQGQESQSEAESEEGRRKFGVTDKKAEKDQGKKQVNHNEFEEAPGSDEEAGPEAQPETKPASNKGKTTTKANNKPRAAPPKADADIPPQEESDAEEDNPWLVQTSRNNRRAKTDDTQQTIDITPDLKSNFKKPAASKSKPAPREAEPEGDEDSDSDAPVPVLLKNHDLVKRAFAGDEVVQEFEQEKLDTIKDEGDKVVDETLPGWGSWTGDGVSRKEKARQRKVLSKVEGVKPENRKDAKMQRVIINEKRVKKNNKYLATQLPHPYESKQQYERSLRIPIGPEWSTKETFQTSTKPRVMVKQGVIKPMEKPMA